MDTPVHKADVQHGQEPPTCLKHCSLGKPQGNSSTIQDRDPWFSKATRDLVSILTTFQESWRQDSEGSAFPEILEAFHSRHWKWRHTKSLMLSCGQNVHTCTSHGFLLNCILPIFLHKLCSFSAQFTWCACTLSHGWNTEVAMQVHSYSGLYLLSPSEQSA